MDARAFLFRCVGGLLPLALITGCGTTRSTDTARTATEQLLISNAVDQTITRLDFRFLSGQKVFFDPAFLDASVDKGYVISSIRQHLLACGALVMEDRTKATYVVEARAGAVGTDNSSLLVGVPQMNLPALVPGQPSMIPEIPLAKRTDQRAVAKVAVYAYNRVTGERAWQSGTLEAKASAKDVWILGAGPFQKGTVRKGSTSMSDFLPINPFEQENKDPAPAAGVAVTQASAWSPTIATVPVKMGPERPATLMKAPGDLPLKPAPGVEKKAIP